ncbi:MAG TPA: hypothetical protein VH518_04085 [Tepidisphaeraceae bacterium]|jgi:hypothetical protein
MRSLILYWFSLWYANVTVSDYVDNMEPLLQQNRDYYLAGPHTPERKLQALAYFDQQWRWLKSGQGCGNKLLGNAGAKCLQDRSRTGDWPWEVYYRDPIGLDQQYRPNARKTEPPEK